MTVKEMGVAEANPLPGSRRATLAPPEPMRCGYAVDQRERLSKHGSARLSLTRINVHFGSWRLGCFTPCVSGHRVCVRGLLERRPPCLFPARFITRRGPHASLFAAVPG
jgi:hypothetical protein